MEHKDIPTPSSNKYIWLTIIFLVISFILFSANVTLFEKDLPINAERFGTFGDFVGGVLGTIFALISIILVLKTFGYQQKVTENNDSLLTTQRFNDLFFELLHLHQATISSLNNNGDKDFFDSEKKSIQHNYRNAKSFEKNKERAIAYYQLFYVKNRNKIGAYFRNLFRIYDLIEHTNLLSEESKKEYSKIVRAQLTENELFFLRYNAMTSYGEAFIPYINRYNILKHLPTFELLEFKDWWEILNESEKESVNLFFTKIKKGVSELLKRNTPEYIKIEFDSHSYFQANFCSSSNFKASIIKQPGTIHSKDFSGLRKFDNKQLQQLLDCFVKEIFIYSNFSKYNDINSIKTYSTPITTNNNGLTTIDSGIKSTNSSPLIVKHPNELNKQKIPLSLA